MQNLTQAQGQLKRWWRRRHGRALPGMFGPLAKWGDQIQQPQPQDINESERRAS
jgi:hypothetical protein